MVTARDRAVRAAFSISSFVISPCSASKSAITAARSASPRSCSTLRRMASFTHALTLTWRFQLSNLIESAVMELDAQGRVISYEEYHPYGSTALGGPWR